MMSRKKLMVVASAAAVALAGGALAVERSSVGVIRWDAQMNNLVARHSGNDTYYVGCTEAIICAYPQFFRRLPFYAEPSAYGLQLYQDWVGEGRNIAAPYGVATPSERLFDPGMKQFGASVKAVEKEVEYAVGAGINYWAFCWYWGWESTMGGNLNMTSQRNIFINLPDKKGLKWCPVLGPMMPVEEENWVIAQMESPDFMTVLDGRPLMYLMYGDSDYANSVRLISSMRNKARAIGKDPYVVMMPFATRVTDIPSCAAAIRDTKADAISWYGAGCPEGGLYTEIMAGDASKRDIARDWGNANGGVKVIPHIGIGHDNRPRDRQDIGKTPDWPHAGWLAVDATPTEITNNLIRAMQWNIDNWSDDLPNSVLIYAWNEFTEGGQQVCPQYNPDDPANPRRDCLDAIGLAIANAPVTPAPTVRYTVTFDENGGDTGSIPGSVKVNAGQVTALPIPPSKVDAVFMGWYTDTGYSTPFTAATPVNGNATVYAKWEAFSPFATITFFDNGAAMTNITVAYGAALGAEMPERPTRNDYVFAGWYTEADGGGTAFNAATPVNADITVYAWWLAEDNNFVKNHMFGMDPVDTRVPTFWDSGRSGFIQDWDRGVAYDSDWRLAGIANGSGASGFFIYTRPPSEVSGAASAYVAQDITGLPDGEYTLTFTASSGSMAAIQNIVFYGYAERYDNGGGTRLTEPVTVTGWGVANYSIENIPVAGGTCRIGVEVDATDVSLDDIRYAVTDVRLTLTALAPDAQTPAIGAATNTVTFDRNYSGSTSTNVDVETGASIGAANMPPYPTNPPYVFAGWTNSAGKAFHSNTPVTGDTTVHAWWLAADNNFAKNPHFDMASGGGWILNPPHWTLSSVGPGVRHLASSDSWPGPGYGDDSYAAIYLIAGDDTVNGTYTSDTFQMLSGIPDGTYTLKAWLNIGLMGGTYTGLLYADQYSNNCARLTASHTAISGWNWNWREATVSNIRVAGGRCVIGFDVSHVKANCAQTLTLRISNMRLTLTSLSPDTGQNAVGDAPEATFSTAAQNIVTTPVTIDITFSEPVTGLTLSGLSTTAGALRDLRGSGGTYTVVFDPLHTNGKAVISLLPGAASNANGDGNRLTQFPLAIGKPKLTLTWDTNGGRAVEDFSPAMQMIELGGKAVDSFRPAPPKPGQHFAGWHLAGAPFDFNTPLHADTTLTAHWMGSGTAIIVK